ncbi:MAG: hypothetical protein KatS3mg062_1187 [Tepidiforma sp.]|nr:MAG: hypothetical protein KatS3mg062_1187 [Tepidiforma sp.]
MAGPLLLAVAAAGWASGGGSTTAHALTNCSTSTQALDAQEQELLRLINEFRAANGVPPLKASPNLSRAAAWMSEDMAAKGYFDHTDSLGRSAFQRVRDCGYASSGAGENLAIASSAQQAFTLFLNSPYGHRENMLRTMWVVAGIGRAGPYWTVDFGNVDDSGQGWDTQPPPQPTATPTRALPTATPTVPAPPAAPTMAPAAAPTPAGASHPASNPFLVRRAVVPNITTEP